MSKTTPAKRIKHLQKLIEENTLRYILAKGRFDRNIEVVNTWEYKTEKADVMNLKAHINRLEKKLAPFKESHPEEFV